MKKLGINSMQIRYCVNCQFQKRDDDFELKHTGENTCPVCESWLWSLNIEKDGIMEIMDWDECGIHDKDLLKILKRSIEVIGKGKKTG